MSCCFRSTRLATTPSRAMWAFARERQAEFDVIVNLAFDWLPIYLTPFLEVPVAHLVSMASINDAMPRLAEPSTRAPGVWRCTATPRRRRSRRSPSGCAWSATASPSSATTCARPPTIRRRWLRRADRPGEGDRRRVRRRRRDRAARPGVGADAGPGVLGRRAAAHPTADVRHEGFLPTDDLQAAIGGCAALLMTPRWVEAFGNVAVEAMACGVRSSPTAGAARPRSSSTG